MAIYVALKAVGQANLQRGMGIVKSDHCAQSLGLGIEVECTDICVAQLKIDHLLAANGVINARKGLEANFATR